MARFVYRLHKVFELRERKKKQQEQRVLEAQAQVRAAEDALNQHRELIQQVSTFMRTAHPSLFETYDYYKEKLRQDEQLLLQQLDYAKDHLAYQKQLLIKAQADVEALVKHRDKAMEEWLELEKAAEMKLLDEIGGQRYFRKTQARIEEEGE